MGPDRLGELVDLRERESLEPELTIALSRLRVRMPAIGAGREPGLARAYPVFVLGREAAWVAAVGTPELGRSNDAHKA